MQTLAQLETNVIHQPNSVELKQALAERYVEQGRWEEAARAYQALLLLAHLNGGTVHQPHPPRCRGVDDRFGVHPRRRVDRLYLTESGRQFREQIEPRLDDLLDEMTRVRGTVEKARTAAHEGWRSLSDITNAQGGRWSA